MKFNKTELYLFAFLSIFALFWVLIVTPYLEHSNTFARMNPLEQYFVFNLGFIMLTIVLINVPYKIVSNREIEFAEMMKAGIVGWLLFSFIFDLWQPPNYLSPQGQILITDQNALPNTAVDAMLYYLWSFVIPATKFVYGFSMLYIAIYFITPIIVVLSMILLLKPSIVKRAILQS